MAKFNPSTCCWVNSTSVMTVWYESCILKDLGLLAYLSLEEKKFGLEHPFGWFTKTGFPLKRCGRALE